MFNFVFSKVRVPCEYKNKKGVLGAFVKLRKGVIKFGMSVCPSIRNNSASNGVVFVKFYWFSENLSRKSKFV